MNYKNCMKRECKGCREYSSCFNNKGNEYPKEYKQTTNSNKNKKQMKK